jgi:hypothetical protein
LTQSGHPSVQCNNDIANAVSAWTAAGHTHHGGMAMPSPRRPRNRLAAPSFAWLGFQDFYGLLHRPWRNMDHMSEAVLQLDGTLQQRRLQLNAHNVRITADVGL